MITKLVLENFLSFKEKESITLNENIFAFIGHNSSGKSNILKALNFFKHFVTTSFNNQPNSLLVMPYNKFKDNEYNSIIEIEFKINDHLYNYTIDFSFYIKSEILLKDGIKVFSLTRTVKNEKEIINNIISKTNTSFNIKYESSLSSSSDIEKFLEFTKPNSTIISTMKNLNSSFFDDIYNYFNNLYVQDAGHTQGHLFTNKEFIELITDEKNKKKILKLLQLVDSEISDYKPITNEVQGQSFEIRFNPNSTENSIETLKSEFTKIDEIFFYKNGREFNFLENSTGVIKLMQLIPNLFDIIKNTGVLIVDEIDTGLNPIIYPKLLSLFEDLDNSMLIFTTHNLLLLEHLKDNQICVIEKKDHHSYSSIINKFYKNKNKYNNYARDYLQGKLTLEYLEKVNNANSNEIDITWLTKVKK